MIASHACSACSLAAACRAPRRRSRADERAIATFAGGCFWCVEADFDKVPGVICDHLGLHRRHGRQSDLSQVSAGGTGHAEAVEVVYDPRKVSYAQAARLVLAQHRSAVKDRQFCDRGDQYRTAIF